VLQCNSKLKGKPVVTITLFNSALAPLANFKKGFTCNHNAHSSTESQELIEKRSRIHRSVRTAVLDKGEITFEFTPQEDQFTVFSYRIKDPTHFFVPFRFTPKILGKSAKDRLELQVDIKCLLDTLGDAVNTLTMTLETPSEVYDVRADTVPMDANFSWEFDAKRNAFKCSVPFGNLSSSQIRIKLFAVDPSALIPKLPPLKYHFLFTNIDFLQFSV
jgi:hypothetical protein